MDITIERAALAAELDLLPSVLGIKKTHAIPALTSIHCSAIDGMLSLSATDLKIWVTSNCPANVREPGEAMLPAILSRDLVREMREKEVDLSVGTHRTEMRVGGFEAKINAIKPSEFPSVPERGEGMIDVPGPMLRDLCERASFAIDDDRDAKPVTQSAIIEHTTEHFRIISTNGYVMAVITAAPVGGQPFTCRLSKSAIDALAAASTEDVARFGLSPTHAFLDTNRRRVVAGLSAEVKFNYRPIFEQPASLMAVVDRDLLLAAADRMRIAAKDEARVAMTIDFVDGDMRVRCRDEDEKKISASEMVPVHLCDDPVSTVTVQARFVTQALKHAPSGPVVLSTQGKGPMHTRAFHLAVAGTHADYVCLFAQMNPKKD